MFKLSAEKILQQPVSTVKENLTGEFELVFPNGETLKTNAVETSISRVVWQLLEQYPLVELAPEHHLGYYLQKDKFSAKTLPSLYSAIYRSVFLLYYHQQEYTGYAFMKRVWEVNNQLYNDLLKDTIPYYTSLDILDFNEIIEDPEIKHIRDNVVAEPQAVDDANKAFISTMLHSEALKQNILVRNLKANNLSPGQLVKCVGICGYITDIDQNIFTNPVLRSFGQGLRSLVDSMMESRSGAKALAFATTPLQQTEYFSRRLQLNTKVIRRLHRGDCGSQHYLNWYVKPRVVDENGELVNKADLPNLRGNYYLDEETNTLKVIKGNEKHLEGKEIKLRNSNYCVHPDAYGVCSTCYGDLASGVPEKANLGHYTTVNMTSPVSQKVLSTKHLDSSAVVSSVYLTNPKDAYFVIPVVAENAYRLSDKIKAHMPKLVIPKKMAAHLSNLETVDNVRTLNNIVLGVYDEFIIEYYPKAIRSAADADMQVAVQYAIPMSVGKRVPSLSYEMLEYIKETGWTYDNKSNYLIDLSNWDASLPVFVMPLRHDSMADYSRDVEKVVECRMINGKKLGARDLRVMTPEIMLRNLFDVTNSQSDVNLSVLSLVSLAMQVRQVGYDYRPPKGNTTREFVNARTAATERNVSMAMAYERLSITLNNPLNFLDGQRTDHPFDMLLIPEQMVI